MILTRVFCSCSTWTKTDFILNADDVITIHCLDTVFVVLAPDIFTYAHHPLQKWFVQTPSSTDFAYHKSGSLMSKYVVFDEQHPQFILFFKCLLLFKSLKALILVVRSGKTQNSGVTSSPIT